MTSLYLLRLLCFSIPALAALHVPLQRRAGQDHTPEQLQAMLKHLRGKYGDTTHASPPSRAAKRQSNTTSSVFTTNHQVDSSYSAQLAIGTPAQTFSVILDTGSSDLWMAGPNCDTCQGMSLWDPTQSSTFQQGTTQVNIHYGSGEAVGTVGSDTVSMGAFTVPSQKLAVIDEISEGLVVNGVSGLMGLGFKSIAETQATPWWEALAQGNVWTEPLMSFYFTRFLNDPSASPEEPGGVFTMGGTNTSLYTGDVDFVPLPDGVTDGFWLLPVDTVEVAGQSMAVSGGSAGTVLGAIDTGTTLIGIPTDAVEEFYSNIPGSQPGTGQWDGYMLYPCSTAINMSINFGSKTWPVSDADFRLARASSSLCAGAVFPLDTGGGQGQPQWVVGDTFLKNVYSVFRFTPPSVGFATLAANGDGSGNLVAGAASRSITVPTLLALAAGGVVAALLA